MIDAGTNKIHLGGVFTQVVHKFQERPLDAVTETDRLDPGGPADGLHVFRHRIGIIQQPRLGTDRSHIAAQAGQQRISPQRSEQPARPRRVSDGEIQAVLARDLKVHQR